MAFNASHVLFLLLQKFTDPIPKQPTTSREERKVAGHLANIIDQALNGFVEVSECEELANDEDGDWEVEEFKPYDDFVLPSHNHVCFDARALTKEEMQEVIYFYRNTEKGTRSLSSMTSRFRWIRNYYHLRRLRQYEKEGEDFKESRIALLKVLSIRLYEVVKEKLENGISLHDDDLACIARGLNRNETKCENFKGSESWITEWKKVIESSAGKLRSL